MLFTKVGYWIAWILFSISALRIATGVFLLFLDVEGATKSERIFSAHSVVNEIEKSLLGLGAAIALGILVEISRNTLKTRQASQGD